MKIRPFIVTHSENFCSADEYDSDHGETAYRYLDWAESHLDAAKTVQAHKKELGRALPDKYKVHGISSQPHGQLHTLGDGMGTDEDQEDLDILEGMFDDGKEILL